MLRLVYCNRSKWELAARENPAIALAMRVKRVSPEPSEFPEAPITEQPSRAKTLARHSKIRHFFRFILGLSRTFGCRATAQCAPQMNFYRCA